MPRADKNTIASYIAGTGSIDQFGDKVRGTYTDKFKSAYDANNDTVGYIEVLGTNVSYPIMFDKTGNGTITTIPPPRKRPNPAPFTPIITASSITT